jgi:probable HAF family extracellular repeat protein
MQRTQHAAQYQVIDLGVLGGASSSASGLNATTEIVGDSDTSGVYSHAFYWTNGRMTDLGTGGKMASTASAINHSGKVKTLPLPQGSHGSMALGVNEKGQIVGTMLRPKDPAESYACLWEADKVTDLGALPGATSSTANKINSHGQIVGSSVTDSGIIRACLWFNGNVVDLSPPKTLESDALAINDQGVIAGYYRVVADEPANHACLFQNGKVRDLGVLPKCTFSRAFGINSVLQVVGDTGVLETNRDRAFLWSNGTMIDLNSRIDAKSGWMLQTATSINERGKIVGRGTIRGKAHAFLLRPVVGSAST